jgi:hypothetical protein
MRPPKSISVAKRSFTLFFVTFSSNFIRAKANNNYYYVLWQESLQEVLDEALQMNEPFDVHCKLLDIYVETGKAQVAFDTLATLK